MNHFYTRLPSQLQQHWADYWQQEQDPVLLAPFVQEVREQKAQVQRELEDHNGNS